MTDNRDKESKDKRFVALTSVFAAVAFSPNIILVCTGVFIGILAMRFVAQGFVKLMETFPFLETSSYVVIGILGIKLVVASLLNQPYTLEYLEEKFEIKFNELIE